LYLGGYPRAYRYTSTSKNGTTEPWTLLICFSFLWSISTGFRGLTVAHPLRDSVCDVIDGHEMRGPTRCGLSRSEACLVSVRPVVVCRSGTLRPAKNRNSAADQRENS